MMKKVRPLKNGGSSECSSPDELVGRGRCCHILGGAPALELRRVDRGIYEINVGKSHLTMQGQREVIAKFFNTLPLIDEEKQRKIIEFLNEEG